MSEESPIKKSKKEFFKSILLSIAEILDAYRFVPRLLLTVYGLLVYKLYMWYTSISTTIQTKCDAALMQILIDHGETIIEAQKVACYISDIIGGPTASQTTFVTVIIGLSTPLIGLYMNSGRKWKDKKTSSENDET